MKENLEGVGTVGDNVGISILSIMMSEGLLLRWHVTRDLKKMMSKPWVYLGETL